jgi:hypothetical protein
MSRNLREHVDQHLPGSLDHQLVPGSGRHQDFCDGKLGEAWGPSARVRRRTACCSAVRFSSGATEHVLTTGGLSTAPIGVPHGFGNASADEPAQLLITVTPQRYIGYFRNLQDLQAGPSGLLDPADIAALMARYATDPYPPRG